MLSRPLFLPISSSAPDVGYFVLEIPDNSAVPFPSVISDGIGLLAPAIQVLNENGQTIASQQSSSVRGDEIVLEIPDNMVAEKMFVRIDGTTFGQAGSYTLVTTLDNRLIVENEVILNVARNREFTFMDQEEVARFFAGADSSLFHEDHHSDDDHESAYEMQIQEGYGLDYRYQRSASLTDAADIDVYKLKSLDFDSSINDYVMNVSLRSVDTGGLIPLASIFDEEGREVPSNVVVNGLGEYVVQATQILPDKEYYVHVAASDLLAFVSGNYELSVSFTQHAIEFQEFAAGLTGGFAPGFRFRKTVSHIAYCKITNVSVCI